MKLGSPLAWTPVLPPRRAPMTGAFVRLEPIDPIRHGADLFQAAEGPGADPHLWAYMPVTPFETEKAFMTWLETRVKPEDPLTFAILDGQTGRATGMASYMRIDRANGVIEIGFIWFGATMQRSPASTEAIYLLARHVFEDLGYRRLEWKCDSLNDRSRRAAERFGFQFEGIFRQHMVIKNRSRDTAWFGMTDGDWPKAKAAFETWLSPENFDANRRQKRSLEHIRSQSVTPIPAANQTP